MSHSRARLRSWMLLLSILGLFLGVPGYSYSVLTHEAIIDTVWTDSIEKLLLQKYPAATPEQLKEAHAYAYGGCVIQDMGYYPMGSHLFTDLTHYVRSGAFVMSLLRDAQDINEYAFALGAMAHYAADNNGHRFAVNLSVPMLYSKLRTKYGASVSYADNPSAHIKTEFGFDVLQVARGRYSSDAYREFIGFKVSKELLERAFQDTYSIELKTLFPSLDTSIGTYRKTASTIIPKATRIAWVLKKKEIEKQQPGITNQKFGFALARGEYEKSWGTVYQKPGIGSRVLAMVIRVIPKVGPLKALAFRTPTPETEKLFLESFKTTLDLYRELLASERTKTLSLPDRNFDLGEPTRAGHYTLADETYAKFVGLLADSHFKGVSESVRQDILAFYSDGNAPIATKRHRKDWQRLQERIAELKSMGAGAH